MKHLSICIVLLALPAIVFAQAGAKIPDPDPEIERKSFILPEGFEVNLFAADPILAKPIQMNFDPQGRLWIASSEVYPQIKPGQKANDKILVLEDTKGVGKADKVTVFADGLLIPTGVEPGDGGVYVANSTELLHLSASKPGEKADRQRVVLSGFGTEDTHHILHTLRWGPDGMLYMNQSIYIHSHIETPYGVRHLNGGGIWQFRPETMQLEVFVRGFINPWGHHVDPYGQSFITDGANGEGITHGIPGAGYPTVVGMTRILHGLNPGSPKHCGLEILSGTHLPEDWRGNLITNDFRGHRVCRFAIKEDGSTYASQEKTELIKSNHPAFRPIDVKMGPDGAIYIADWYNPIIQHGEIDFRDPRRDHTHGRIWRITAKGRPLVKRPDLVGASTRELLDFLKSPDDWTRHNAKRVLKERGPKDVLPALKEWLAKLDPKDAEFEHQKLEALWVYQSLNTVEPALLGDLLQAHDYRIRAAATRVLSQWHERVPNAQELLAARVADDNPRVRMEAVRALGALKNARAAELALTALDRPIDRVLEYSLWLTAKELEPYWMPEFSAGKLDFGGNPARLTFALQSAGSASAMQPLLTMLKSGKIGRDREDAVWAVVANLGGPGELRAVLERVISLPKEAAKQAQLLAALEESARQRRVAPSGDNLGPLKELLASKSEAVRAAACRLVGYWKQKELTERLFDAVKTEGKPRAERQAAFDGLVLLGGKPIRDDLERLTQAFAEYSEETYRLAVIALTALDVDSGAKRAVEILASAKPSEELLDIYSAFLQRKGGSAALAKALVSKKLSADVAKFGIKAVRASVQDAPGLIEALTKAGDLAAQKRELTPKELQEMVADVARLGSAERGEALYRRADMQCLKCHAIAGAGGQVGPDLGSIGASAPVDYLIDSLLLPNKAVKEGFHALRIEMLDGKAHTGIKVRETNDQLVLRTVEDKELVLPVKEIEQKRQSRSLMPDGLADSLTRGELIDLVRFLSELGKLGPYAPSKARLVRRWQALQPTPPAMDLIRRSRIAAAAESDPVFQWQSVYSKVSGELPLDAIPSLVVWRDTAPLAVVRCQLDVTAAGKVKLKFNSVAGITLMLGPTPIDARQETVLELQPGVQTLLLAVDLTKRKEPLRCELEDVPDSPARASVLGGK